MDKFVIRYCVGKKGKRIFEWQGSASTLENAVEQFDLDMPYKHGAPTPTITIVKIVDLELAPEPVE